MRKFKKEEVYFTSDLHFGHDKEHLYGGRGFASIEEHDEAIINNWNSVIDENKVVFVLGDIMMGGDHSDKIKRLNGTINIILGNHDLSNYKIEAYKNCPNVDQVLWAEMIQVGRRQYYLSHHPTLLANFDQTIRTVNLHGHLHSSNKFVYDHCYNVNPEAHNMTPVNIVEILEDINRVEGK